MSSGIRANNGYILLFTFIVRRNIFFYSSWFTKFLFFSVHDRIDSGFVWNYLYFVASLSVKELVFSGVGSKSRHSFRLS